MNHEGKRTTKHTKHTKVKPSVLVLELSPFMVTMRVQTTLEVETLHELGQWTYF